MNSSTTPVYLGDLSDAYPPNGTLAHQDRGLAFIAFCVVMGVLALVALTVRFYSRLLQIPRDGITSRFWWDDWLVLAAMPFEVACEVTICAIVPTGLAKHMWNVPIPNLIIVFKALFAAEILYIIGLTLAKASALFFYSRIFHPKTAPRWFRWGLYALHSVNIAWFIAIALFTVFRCNPVEKSWDILKEGHCASISSSWLVSGISSVAIDILILLLPLPMIWKLNLDRGKRTALTALFAFGYSIPIISIGRIVMIVHLTGRINYDITYEGIPILYWFAAEIPMTMLGVCLPAMSYIGRQVTAGSTLIAKKVKQLMALRKNSRSSSRTAVSRSGRRARFESEKKSKMMSRSESPNYNARGYKAYASYASEEVRSIENRSNESLEGGSGVIWVRNAFTVSSTDATTEIDVDSINTI